MIKHDNHEITLYVISPVYKTKLKTVKDGLGNIVKNEDGKPVKGYEEVWHKDIRLKTIFQKDAITLRGETLDRKNKPCKKRCVIYDKYIGKFFTIAHSLSELEQALNGVDENTPIGFKRY
jgi:hypothetical protein